MVPKKSINKTLFFTLTLTLLLSLTLTQTQVFFLIKKNEKGT